MFIDFEREIETETETETETEREREREREREMDDHLLYNSRVQPQISTIAGWVIYNISKHLKTLPNIPLGAKLPPVSNHRFQI